MLGVLRKLSIKKQLMILVICTFMVIFMVIFVEYYNISNVTIKANNEYTREMFSQIKRNISDNSDLLTKMLNSTAYNKVVQDYMIETDTEKAYELFKNVDSIFTNMMGIKDEILDFVVLKEKGKSYFQSGRNEYTLAVLDKLPKNSVNYYSPMEKLEYSGSSKDCFVVASNILQIIPNSNLSKGIGVVAIVVNAKLLSAENNTRFKESSTKFYLLDRNNKVYSSNDASTFFDRENINAILDNTALGQSRIILNNKDYIINIDSIPQTGGKIISIIPEDDLLKDVLWIRKLTFSILVFGLLLLSIPFTIIINNILQPLNKFSSFMEKVKNGSLKGLKQRVQLQGYSEIEVMSGEFNNMLDEIDGLTHRLINTSTRLYETELDKKQAELAYLKSQINPHFLYNTFESMIGTAYEEGANRTIDMIKALVQIFRYSIKGADIVKLSEELEIVKSYIFIQQVRFVNMFDVKYEIDEKTLDLNIPKIILQPIVENAISHGLETKLDYGHLCIGSEIDDNKDLCIWVYDDGMGIDEDVLKNIMKLISESSDKSFSQKNNDRIGVVNVNSRIKFIFGVEYGIEIDSKQGEGTRVRIRIPARRDENV